MEMSLEQKAAINDCRDRLVDILSFSVNSLTVHLMIANVINFDDEKEIKIELLNKSKMMVLLEKIKRKSSGWPSLIDFLNGNGFQYLAIDLEKQLASVKQPRREGSSGTSRINVQSPMTHEEKLRDLKYKQAALLSESVVNLFGGIVNDETLPDICRIMQFDRRMQEYISFIPGSQRMSRLLGCMEPVIGPLWDDFIDFLRRKNFAILSGELEKQLEYQRSLSDEIH